LLLKLRQALEDWLELTAAVQLDEPLPLAVVREAWLGLLEQGKLGQRFLSGAVNFCTLMPMRAIPFRVVCLLGMNDGDYPRSTLRLDFDLMAGDYRPATARAAKTTATCSSKPCSPPVSSCTSAGSDGAFATTANARRRC